MGTKKNAIKEFEEKLDHILNKMQAVQKKNFLEKKS